MSELTKANFETTYANSSGTFATNTTRAISEADMRQFADDIADSVQFKDFDLSEVIISSASVLTGNASPVTIVAAQGSNMVIVPVAFHIHLKYNSAAYATNTTFRFEINGTPVSNTNTTILPGTADRYTIMNPIDVDTTTDLRNQALVFEVQTGNPTAGNSPLYISCIYRVVEALITV